MQPTDAITAVPGIGGIIAKRLARLDITSVFDLLYHLPFRYEDRSAVCPTRLARVGQARTFIGTLQKITNQYTHKGKAMQKATLADDSGVLDVIWFNQPFLTRILKPGQKIGLYGQVDFFSRRPALVSPEYEVPSDDKFLHVGRIVAIYPETSGVSSKFLRTKIDHVIESLTSDDFLPSTAVDLNWKRALTQVHFPSHMGQVAPGRRRLAWDELFLLHSLNLVRRQQWSATRLAHSFRIDQDQVRGFIKALPFTLTPSQQRAIKDLLNDLGQKRAMNRLLEGDVGSGKTVVAAVAAFVAARNGFQTLVLAPTQILASQHFQTLSTLFRPLGITLGLITGAKKAARQTSSLPIIVGTHALLSTSAQFAAVGLVVIDEQHRFGVVQRALAAAKGQSPHILTMTATPIPRTVALTLYGDLDLSTLDELPGGRLAVKTWLVPEAKRAAAYGWIKSQISNLKSQVFVVCPFIDESESMASVKAATAEFEKLKRVFPHFRLGLLHGKQKTAEKDEVMAKFRAGESDVLVTTPVVEVGVDIPSATIMVIEAAERFGLAQLHQLRGRVGRSARQSYCLLFSSHDTARLRAMERHHLGRQLAEIDFKLRGPGEIYGTSQHGLPAFKVASFNDLGLAASTRQTAAALLPQLDELPGLRALLEKDKITLVQPN